MVLRGPMYFLPGSSQGSPYTAAMEDQKQESDIVVMCEYSSRPFSHGYRFRELLSLCFKTIPLQLNQF